MNKCTKSFFGIALILAAFGLFVPSVDAAIGISTPTGITFDVKITEIAKIENTNQTRFSFEPIAITNTQNINHFKIRVYCEEPTTSVTVNTLTENMCGKATRIEKTADNKSFVILSNPTGKTVGFSFKLKAYDKNGNWLHTEREGFRWK